MTNKLSSLFGDNANIQALTQRLPEMISLMLVLACAYSLAVFSWSLVPYETEPATETPAVTTGSPVKKVNASLRLREITSAHLFGTVTRKPRPTTKAPETKLSLVLKGVLAASPMSMASAIIARKKNGPEETYSVGDKLPGNVLIKEIHADHVIISRGGKLETLRLPKDRTSQNLIKNKPFPSRTTTTATTLRGLREQVVKDPTSFGDYALPVVVKERGKQIGYRLDLQEKGDVLKQAGLRATDVITAINGMKLDTPQKSIRALRKLRSANRLNLIVRRDGNDINLNLQL